MEQNTQMQKGNGSISKDAKTMAMFCHLAVFAGCLIPFANLIAPLIIWRLNKDKDPFIDDQGKEVVNFQISTCIYAIICTVLILFLIGIFLLIVLGIFVVVVTIIGALKANEGVAYRYPLCIRFIK